MTKIIISALCLLVLSTTMYAKNDKLTTDEGVVINGIRWATRNVDAPGTFTENPEDFGMLYQWNRKKGWNTTDRDVEDWETRFTTRMTDGGPGGGSHVEIIPEFGELIVIEIDEDGTEIHPPLPPYHADWETESAPCPPGWRVPTADELRSLRDAGGEWTTKNGVYGMLFGIAPNQIFLPAVGERRGSDGRLFRTGIERGHYWSSTRDRQHWTLIMGLSFDSHWRRVVVSSSSIDNGHSIRCVAID